MSMFELKLRDGNYELELESQIKNTRGGGEALVFTMPFGFFRAVFIAIIPGNGETKAPVHVKIEFDRPKRQQRQQQREPSRAYRRPFRPQESEIEDSIPQNNGV